MKKSFLSNKSLKILMTTLFLEELVPQVKLPSKSKDQTKITDMLAQQPLDLLRLKKRMRNFQWTTD